MIGARIAAMLQQGEHFVRAVCARLAWPEYLFLALTLFTVGMWIWVNGPLQGEIEQLRAERAQHQVPDRGAAADGLEARASDLTADFLSFLPPWAERDRQMASLHAMAAGLGIELTRVAYTHVRLAHLPVRKTSLQMTFQATDAVHHGWVRDLLRGMPNLGIDRLDFNAPTTPGEAGKMLHVRMEASLFYRDAKEP